MVDLPSIPDRLVTTQQTTYGQYLSPLSSLSDALDKTAKVAEDVNSDLKVQQKEQDRAGVPQAESEGGTAVGRDKDGNLTVQLRTGTDARTQAYNRTATLSYVTQLGTLLQSEAIQKQNEFTDDPVGYKKWSDGRVERVRAEAEAQNPLLTGPAVGQAMQVLDQHYLGLQQSTLANQTARQIDSTNTRLKQLDNDSLTIASQPGGLSSPFLEGHMHDYKALLDDQVRNPHVLMSADKAAQMYADFRSRVTIAAAVPLVNTAYQDGLKTDARTAYANALAKADELSNNPALSATPAERAQWRTTLTGDLKTNEAARRGSVQALDGNATTFLTNAGQGTPYRPQDVADLSDQYRALGEPVKAAHFQALASRTLAKGAFLNLGAQDRARVLHDETTGSGEFAPHPAGADEPAPPSQPFDPAGGVRAPKASGEGVEPKDDTPAQPGAAAPGATPLPRDAGGYDNAHPATPPSGQGMPTLAQTVPDSTTANGFLKTRVVGHGPEAVDGLQPQFQSRLQAMIQAAPADIQQGLGLFSGFRSVARQQQLFDASDRSGHMVARPGHSMHNSGLAADLSYNGQSLSKAPPEVVSWLHQNAGKYGLKFPMPYENWHVEPVETRGGGMVGSSQPAASPQAATDRAGYNATTGGYYGRLIQIESSGDPSRTSPTGAKGLGQFTDQTWARYGNGGDPYNPADNMAALRRLTADNADALQAGLGREPTDGELYLAHQQGAAGALALLQHPERNAVDALADGPYRDSKDPQAAAARAIKVNGGREDMTAGDFAAMWEHRFDNTTGTASDAPGVPQVVDPAILQMHVQQVNTDFPSAAEPILKAVRQGQPLSQSDGNYLTNVGPFLTGQNQDTFKQIMLEQRGLGQFAGTSDELGMTTTQRQQALTIMADHVSQGASAPERAFYDDARTLDRQLAEQEKSDPLLRGVQAHWVPNTPLDIGEMQAVTRDGSPNLNLPPDLAAQLKARSVASSLVAARLGQPAIGLFTADEAGGFVDILKTVPADQAGKFLGVLANGTTPDQYRETLRQIGQKDPTSSFPMAGALYKSAPEVAFGIIRGERALADNDKLAPKVGDDTLQTELDTTLPSDVVSPGGYALLVRAGRALYADRSLAAGDTSGKLNGDRLSKAMSDVAGGILDYHGTPMIAPDAGMTQQQLDARIGGLTSADMAGAVTPSGQPVSPDVLKNGTYSVFGNSYPRLLALGGGSYAINMGTAEAPAIVQARNGGMFTLRLGSPAR